MVSPAYVPYVPMWFKKQKDVVCYNGNWSNFTWSATTKKLFENNWENAYTTSPSLKLVLSNAGVERAEVGQTYYKKHA